MRNFVQSGVNITVPAPADTISGQGVSLGSIFGVASNDAKTGEPLDLVTEGVFALGFKVTDTFAIGDKAYWSGTALTASASGNTKIGYIVAVNAATLNVRLIPAV